MPSWKKVLVSGSDAALNSLNVTTSLTASGLIYPTVDGLSNQVILTDGNGNLSFSNIEYTSISIKNVSGGTITKGTPCYITGSGTSGNVAGVWPADASNPARMPAGVIAGETLNNGDEGLGLINGFINGVNTLAFAAGDSVYVAVGGGYTNIRPTGSAILVQKLGNVEKVDALNGSGVINGPGYYNDLPNVQQGYTWVGNADGVAIAIATSSIQNVVSASFASTASSVNTLNQNVLITGSIQVTGSFSVQDSIDSSNKWLIGLGAMPGTTSTAVDWNSRVLYDTTGTTTSIDWQTRTLANSTGINNVDWENRYLYGPGPIPTSTEIAVDWNARQLSNSNGNIILDWGDSSPQFSGTASFATSASWAPGGGASFPYTGSAEITGSLGITGSFSVLDSIDATNKILIGSGPIPGSTEDSVNWDSRTLFDTNGNFSIRWGNLRTMYDANVSASIDWNTRQLKDANGIDIVNWQSGISITGSNITTGSVEVTGSFKVQDSIDSSNKWLIGPGGIPGSTATAVAWSDRQLLNSSGATIVNWETGVLTGTATSASFAATASFINPLNQSMVITGSLRGQVSALSILSNTASVDMVTNNFFTLTLANGVSTNINPTNINPGQTVNILVTQGSAGTGTVTFPSLVKQASGSLYTGSAVANAVDIVTMIAFDATNVYVSSIQNMI